MTRKNYIVQEMVEYKCKEGGKEKNEGGRLNWEMKEKVKQS